MFNNPFSLYTLPIDTFKDIKTGFAEVVSDISVKVLKEEKSSNVYEALKPGARLIVRDSLTKTDYREIFLYNFISGYQAVYRNVECYRELFVRCGFEIESEIALKEEVTDGIEYVNYGAILKKA